MQMSVTGGIDGWLMDATDRLIWRLQRYTGAVRCGVMSVGQLMIKNFNS